MRVYLRYNSKLNEFHNSKLKRFTSCYWCRKIIWQNSYPFMIKGPRKLELEGNFLNFIKVAYERPTSSIILNGEISRILSLRLGIRQGYSLLSLLFNIILTITFPFLNLQLFPIANETNYHKFSAQKNTNVFSSSFGGLKSKIKMGGLIPS